MMADVASTIARIAMLKSLVAALAALYAACCAWYLSRAAETYAAHAVTAGADDPMATAFACHGETCASPNSIFAALPGGIALISAAPLACGEANRTPPTSARPPPALSEQP